MIVQGALPENSPSGLQYIDARVRKSQGQELDPRSCLRAQAVCSAPGLAKHIRRLCCPAWVAGSNDWEEYIRILSNRSECGC